MTTLDPKKPQGYCFKVKGDGPEVLTLRTDKFSLAAPDAPFETAGPLGTISWQKSGAKRDQQCLVTLTANDSGDLRTFLDKVAGSFLAFVYEGTPDQFDRSWILNDCSFKHWTGSTQVTGTLAFTYLGETAPDHG